MSGRSVGGELVGAGEDRGVAAGAGDDAGNFVVGQAEDEKAEEQDRHDELNTYRFADSKEPVIDLLQRV
jgi:hypothetical protein